jgi:hypothetical protein
MTLDELAAVKERSMSREIDATERKFLTGLRKRQEDGEDCTCLKPEHPVVVSLIDRGYIKFVKGYCVGHLVTEHWMEVTEAGSAALRACGVTEGEIEEAQR